MEFSSDHGGLAPRNTYPCLATIGFGTAPPTHHRRLSFGSGGQSGGEEESGLKRVISGGRRKSSFGAGEDGMGRRAVPPPANEGPWYWRVQAGVTDTHLVLLPLSQPPNPLLTSPPAPLSHAMPAHSAVHNPTAAGGDGEGFTDKLKHLFRRSSAAPHNPADTGAEGGLGTQASVGQTGTAGETIIDQNSRGDQLASAEANKLGATGSNANAELGWPGMIDGERLGLIKIPLGAIGKSVQLGGGKKNEGSWVTLVVNQSGGYEPVGSNAHGPRAGHIKLEFDKDWIGAKGEAEVLHHQISSAVENFVDSGKGAGHNPLAGQESFQLGHHSAQAASAGGLAPALADDVAPDESVVSSRSGKVAG